MKTRLLVLALLLSADRLSAATYYVAPDGSDAGTCVAAQSLPNAKLTLASGVACLTAGDTLLIRGGTYAGPLNVIDSQTFTVRGGTGTGSMYTNPLTIAAFPGETVIIKPSGNRSAVRLTRPANNYTIIRDLEIDMSLCSPGDDADGVIIYGTQRVKLENIHEHHGCAFGIHVGQDTPGIEIRNSDIHHNKRAGAPDVTHNHGLYFSGPDCIIEDNIVHHNGGFGIHAYNNDRAFPDSPSRCIIRRNQVYNNDTNGFGTGGIVVAGGTDEQITDNHVTDNGGNGIQVYTNAKAVIVERNTVSGNTADGIWLQYYGSAPTIRNNVIFGNRSPIVDFGGTGTPIIVGNTFTDPSIPLDPVLDPPVLDPVALLTRQVLLLSRIAEALAARVTALEAR